MPAPATAVVPVRAAPRPGTYASPQLRWSLLLNDHPTTPPPVFEVGADPAPKAFADDHPCCVVTVSVPGRFPVQGYRSLRGVRQGDVDHWWRRCAEAFSDALEAAGYPATIEDLKLVSRWLHPATHTTPRHDTPPPQPAPAPPPSTPDQPADTEPHGRDADATATVEAVLASLGSRRPALEAWAKNQGLWPPTPDNADRLIARAAELAADETFVGPLTDPEEDPVETARQFLDRMGVAVPAPEPLDTVSAAEIAAVRAELAALDDRMADADDELIARLAQHLEDEGFPLLVEAMTPDQLRAVGEWLTNEGLP